MEARGGLADEFVEARLDVHVEVFELLPPVEHAVGYLAVHGVEPLHDGVRVDFGDDALPAEHAGVRDRPRDVVLVQTAVVADGDRIAGRGLEVVGRVLGHGVASIVREGPLTTALRLRVAAHGRGRSISTASGIASKR